MSAITSWTPIRVPSTIVWPERTPGILVRYCSRDIGIGPAIEDDVEKDVRDRAGGVSPILPDETPAVHIGWNAAGGAAEQAQDGRLVIGRGRLRQQVEVTLDEPRNGGAAGGRVAFCPADHFPIDAQRELRHIRMMAPIPYVSSRDTAAATRSVDWRV
jgi:hypothetical protein